MDWTQVLVRPWVTEKGMTAIERRNTYPFEVHPRATKIDIRRAVESKYEVKVVGVHTLSVHGKIRRHRVLKAGRTADRKKALVTLKEGDKIEFI